MIQKMRAVSVAGGILFDSKKIEADVSLVRRWGAPFIISVVFKDMRNDIT